EEPEDPRDERGKKYPLMDVMIPALYGALIGYEDFTNMSYYLKKREAELTERFGLSNGIPSHDTFSAVFRIIDVKQFMRLFVEWTRMIVKEKSGKQIAIDGKAVRAARKKAEEGNIPYVISAFLCETGITIGQKEVGEKTNEITEIPKLPDMIDITGCVVTIDAIGTQKEIMDKIIDKGGHFCLQVKMNRRAAFEAMELYFTDLNEEESKAFGEPDRYEMAEADHGRIEKRVYCTETDPEKIHGILPDEKWKHVQSIGMARLTRETAGHRSTEMHFHVMDQKLTAKQYGKYARGHRGIENSLHWVLDIHFNEDKATARSENSISNLTLLRKMALNLTKPDPKMAKKTTKKKMIDFMTEPELFSKFVFEVLPDADA
ncbi:MAG: ISAs1 family transposase, partial [Bacillota bacterium]|nr:ISAs1 family transposase [Bacillota bacterium]